jgi:hypothetical protein
VSLVLDISHANGLLLFRSKPPLRATFQSTRNQPAINQQSTINQHSVHLTLDSSHPGCFDSKLLNQKCIISNLPPARFLATIAVL